MPRKSTASATAASTTTASNGNVSMLSEAHVPSISSPKISSTATEDQALPQPEKPEHNKQTTGSRSKKSDGDVVALDDLLLPRSIIQRLSKGVLPSNTSISRDAILALTKSATVFISMLADAANDMTDKKTIQSADVIRALREVEMGDVMGVNVLGKDGKRGGRVEREVERWEGDVRGKRRGYREKVRARESGAGDTTVGDTTMGTMEGGNEEEEHEHENKRVRIDEVSDGSAGPLAEDTSQLKINGGRRKSHDPEEELGDDAEEPEIAESELDEENEGEEEEEQNETQDVEESIDMEEVDSRRKNGTLAPDGRIEVGESDDESD